MVQAVARPSRRQFFAVCGVMATPPAPSAPARGNGHPTSRGLAPAWRAASILLMTPLANFRNTFLPDRKDLLGPLLLYAQAMGGLTWGTSRLDGTTIPAEASKRQAMRDQRRLERDRPLRAEGAKWFARTEPAEPTERPARVVIAAASAFGPERLANLAQAPAG